MWKANKLINILLWVLALISVAVCVYFLFDIKDYNPKIPDQKDLMLGALTPVFFWVCTLIVLTIALTVLLPIPALVQNPKSALGILGGIVAVGVVILLAYSLSSTEALPFTPGHEPVSSETLTFADVNMISTYIMLGGTILVLVGTGLKDMIKMR